MTRSGGGVPARTVGIIGYGAIGSVLAGELRNGQEGLILGGAVGRRAPDEVRVATVEQLIDRCEIIVEAAGQQAVQEYGRRILSAGRDLLVLSVGAFADEQLLEELSSLEGGRLLISTGAIGGLDLLRAAALSRRLEEISITTTKPAAALIDVDEHGSSTTASDPCAATVVFEGSAREAASRYPTSTNVAATVGLSTLGMDRVRVQLIADPAAETVSHHIRAGGPIGTYDFSIRNAPSENPRTSSITPYAALRALRDAHARLVVV